MFNFGDDSSWIVLLAAAVALVVALIVHRAGAAILQRITRGNPVARAVVDSCRRPAGAVLPLLALQSVWQAAPDPLPLISLARHGNGLLLLAALTWLGLRALRGATQSITARHSADGAGDLNARSIHTQTRLLVRIGNFVIVVTGLALMLMTFPGARQIGGSLLASAGVLGILAGIAARPVFSNVIAGLQLAISQPLRVHDVLIVQGEWGTVEEITGTYVVLKIWDERRLIIPLQWFMENPFQNWTRNSAQILGAVTIWVDYRMPLEPLRQAAQRACEAAAEWDKRLCLLQMVEAGERSMQLRVLVSSADSALCWDLRCKVREAMVDCLQRDYPQHLPMMRAELTPTPGKNPEKLPVF